MSRFGKIKKRSVWKRLFSFLQRPEWGPGFRIRLALAWLLTTTVIGAFLLDITDKVDRTFWESFWLVFTTITTVGYGHDYPRSFAAQAIMIGILGNGFLSVSLATASFVELLVEGGIARILGRRSLESQIARMKDHFIICGYGRMGRMICREIKSQVDVLVIEKSDEEFRHLEEDDVIYLVGDATEEETLERAGIERARGLVSVVASDAENVFIVLTAREMSRGLYILARAVNEQSERKILRAGANKVISPYLIGGLRMAHAILKPAVVDFMEFVLQSDKLDVQVEEILVEASSELAGIELQSSGISALNVIVMAIKRSTGRMEFNPSRQTIIQAGDTLIVMGPEPGLEQLVKKAE
ncbi:MAG: potassium channel protein [Planctomycetota bacterium]|nr:potassium channel protein [Planctomycetota bacterium]